MKGSRNVVGGTALTRAWLHTCVRPNSSKWLSRKVLIRTMAKPMANRAHMRTAPLGFSIFQTLVGMGRQKRNMTINERLAHRIEELRSIRCGTMRIQTLVHTCRSRLEERR